MVRSRTTAYHPQCNRKSERFNQSLLEMLRTGKGRWHEYIPKVVHVYNCISSKSAAYSPFFLFFGRSPRLAIDIILGTSPDSMTGNRTSYVEKWKSAMTEAYSLAAEKARSLASKEKSFQDRKAHYTTLEPGTEFLKGILQNFRTWRAR